MPRIQGSMTAIMPWLVMALLSWSPLAAEIVPTSGTAEGIYHQDRWGVGHFDYFIVDPGLHAKLHPYEGRRIRFKITKAEQPMNPGPGILLALDGIEETIFLGMRRPQYRRGQMGP